MANTSLWRIRGMGCDAGGSCAILSPEAAMARTSRTCARAHARARARALHVRRLRMAGEPVGSAPGTPDWRSNFGNAKSSGEKTAKRRLIEALERHYGPDLDRVDPSWCFPLDGPAHPPVNIADVCGVPPVVLGAILAGKCRDQGIQATEDRQRRFAEYLYKRCASSWFTLHDSGAGPECTKGVVLALALNENLTSLNLSCNLVRDEGAGVIAKLLPEQRALVHLDLSSNDITGAGAGAIFEALLLNRSLTDLNLSSQPGAMRNRLTSTCSKALEEMLMTNPVLASLSLRSTCVGYELARGLGRGMARSSTLLRLSLANNELRPESAMVLFEAFGPECGLEELDLSENLIGDEGFAALAVRLGAPPAEPTSSTRSGSSASARGGGESARASPESRRGSVGEERHPSSARSTPSPQARANHGRSSPSISPAVRRYYTARAALLHAIQALSLDDSSEVDACRPARVEAQARIDELRVTLSGLGPLQLPRLRVLLLGSNRATFVGASRIEDALMVNNCIEKLSLDNADHGRVEYGVAGLVAALPVNTGLRSLSLVYCGLKDRETLDLMKALTLNWTLESLSLRGNHFGDEAAAVLGSVFGSERAALKVVDLCCCHVSDNAGVSLAGGLETNRSLEVLRLRENLIRERTGQTFAENLRSNTTLLELDIELNFVEFIYVSQIRQILDRNARMREDGRSGYYRRRIAELKECAREVIVLQGVVARNCEIRQAAIELEEADGIRFEELRSEARDRRTALEELLQRRSGAHAEAAQAAAAAQEALQDACNAGEATAAELRRRIEAVNAEVARHEASIEEVRKKTRALRETAGQELSELQRECREAESARDSALRLRNNTRRNRDSLVASLRSIEDVVAGGMDPRQRERSWRVGPRSKDISPLAGLLPDISGVIAGAAVGSSAAGNAATPRGTSKAHCGAAGVRGFRVPEWR
eukprot:TRINITY_DN11806_c0_g1_i3.p1 TRINITY_DN11806_c0_g1~~TRINITY_DN11806_c0_g1_i3.p1  ORF type:complete len:943 (+),score=156.66 TRINITY_DN11806_c0_g1_i3:2866-5694(+)